MRRFRDPSTDPELAASDGFTLLELLVVIAVLGLITRLVVPSFGSDLPEAEVRQDAESLAATLNFLRSESRLRARRYGLEIDLERNRYRVQMPPEFEVKREQSQYDLDDAPKFEALSWSYLNELVRFKEVHVGLDQERPSKSFVLQFDPRGRTGPKVLVLDHAQDPELVYSVVLPSIAGQILVESGRHLVPTAKDHDF